MRASSHRYQRHRVGGRGARRGPGKVGEDSVCTHEQIWRVEGGMPGVGDTSVCISAAEPPLEKRERGRWKKGGEPGTAK